MTAPLTPAQQSECEYRKAPETVGRYAREVDIVGKTVLDFGCGWGGETLWLCEHGAGRVLGVDPDPATLEQARAYAGSRAELFPDPAGIESDSVDAIFSTDVFEHVMDLPAALDELHRVLKPGGHMVSRFGPLFYSPYGCHFYWANPFPYGHLLLGRRWLKRRIDRVRGYVSDTTSWADMGFNRITFPEFAGLIRERFEVIRLEAIPVMGQRWAVRVPGLRRFMTFGCDLLVTKAS